MGYVRLFVSAGSDVLGSTRRRERMICLTQSTLILEPQVIRPGVREQFEAPKAGAKEPSAVSKRDFIRGRFSGEKR